MKVMCVMSHVCCVLSFDVYEGWFNLCWTCVLTVVLDGIGFPRFACLSSSFFCASLFVVLFCLLLALFVC